MNFCLFFGHVATATLPHHKQKFIRQSFSKSASYKFKSMKSSLNLNKSKSLFKNKDNHGKENILLAFSRKSHRDRRVRRGHPVIRTPIALSRSLEGAEQS